MRSSGTLAVFIVLLATSGDLVAQYSSRRGGEGVEVEGYAGVFFPKEPAFQPGELGFNLDPRDILVGGRLGYTFPLNFFVQGEFGYSPMALVENGGGVRNINTVVYGGSLGYNFQVASPAQLFLLGGAGVIHWDPDGLPQENQLRLHVGGGARFFLTRVVAIRIEARDHIVPATMSKTRQNLAPGIAVTDELTHNLEVSGGISLFFDTRRDSDRDGIADDADRCPGTPRGVLSDARGCPLDGDADGVEDYRDRCAGTPATVSVDASGCALDVDGDGVPDGRDLCPNTEAGAQVDANGCALDSDGDRVPDGRDACAGTPAGAQVDETGCVLDLDGDGVSNGTDRCPSTPTGRAVNEEGCSRIEAGLEAGRLILSEISFETNSANLNEESRRILDEVAEALLARPDLEIEIQGHTDSVGSAAANLRLSDRRAQAVYEYLIRNHSNLGPGRFVVRGFGETSPIASNDTASGRRANRRVEFVVMN
ncbi:MAG: OmpA family protein [Gemmatimonadota bacterium]|nr:MAG: OmpA family protein [Gemmatimonadota bacterium]